MQGALQGRLAHDFEAFGQGGFDGALDLVGAAPNGRALFFGELSQPVKSLHDWRTAAQVGYTPGLQRGVILYTAQCRQGGFFDLA